MSERSAMEIVHEMIRKAALQPGMALENLRVPPDMYAILVEECGMDPSIFFKVDIISDGTLADH